MGKNVRLIYIIFILSALVLINACGGGDTEEVTEQTTIPSPPTAPPSPPVSNKYSVGGSVSGLLVPQLTIQSNLADEIIIDADGSFVFSTYFQNEASYEVVIIVQPQAQTCTLVNGSGQVLNQNVTDVVISCVENIQPPPSVEREYSVSGSVTGLVASQVSIQSNRDDQITIEADGRFIFPTVFENGSTYQVLIINQPEAQTCSITNANGQIMDENVTNVTIVCENNPPPQRSYSLSGTISGLTTSQIVIQSNLADEITIDVDGNFVFPTDFPNGSDYEVTILLQPQTLTCTATNASGKISSADVTNIMIMCEETSYDIVYVRYPNETDDDQFVNIPQGEHAYDIAGGADLMLLKPDGSEIVLVDCTECSVMDPFISFDGKTVYYSLIESASIASASWIYKIKLSEDNYEPIRLTFDDGFDSSLYANNTTAAHDQGSMRGIRDMAPSPLADGRIVFTSNRSALTTFRPGTNAVVKGSVQQLYVIDDHDGSANTKELSNLHLLETGNLHMVQHPFQLKDGRILFSTWQDAATKFSYAMTSLFTVYPDGSNLQQFTEPHDHHKNVDHFATQLAEESVVSGYYYPSFDYGFGILMKYPISSEGPDFLRGSIDQKYTWGQQTNISFREFDRKGTESITPHTTSADVPAPNLSGKYSMPSTTIRDGLLVAYSTGSVNHFNAVCNKSVNLCEPLRSGVYLIEDASTAVINSPASLIKIKDDPYYNEIWPRAVASYYDIHGQKTPDIIESEAIDGRLHVGEAAGLVGSSSMMNREPLNDLYPDPFSPSERREANDGNWRIEGAEAGVVRDDDIYGVRIIVTPPKPFTRPIRKYGSPLERSVWNSISRYLADSRLNDVVARYSSLHGERWEILGEFPLTHTDTTDEQGNPDTSWVAKVPADTPFLIQTLDANGMTVISELTWRGVKSGENRTDCGGCHAHSVEPLDFETTEAGKSSPITNVANLDLTDPIIQEGLWDLTRGNVPLLSEAGVSKDAGYSYGVEFNRDVLPIINTSCMSCHSADGTGNMLILDGTSDTDDAYAKLTRKAPGESTQYKYPQVSKYIRVPQARQSLLTWVVWGERLDGRTNSDRANDVDYPSNHPQLQLTDLEKRTVARWIDLGAPIDFPELDLSDLKGFRYTDDYQLPVINIEQPKRGVNATGDVIIGLTDAKAGLNWNSLAISYYSVGESQTEKAIAEFVRSDRNIISFSLPTLMEEKQYILKVEVMDNAGNKNIQTVNFTIKS
jgi:hypothetical protein